MNDTSELICRLLDRMAWLCGVVSIIMSYQYHLRTGVMFLVLMTVLFCVAGILGIVSKNYNTISLKQLGQRVGIYVVIALFFILALLSDKVINVKYAVIVLEAAAIIIQGVWIFQALRAHYSEWKPKKITIDKNVLILFFIGILQWILVMQQAKSQYIWDSRDYCEQVNSMVQTFDFTFNHLGTIFLGHISAGFTFVYEFAFFLFGGDLNRLIYMNAILGILVQICVYQIFGTFFPRVKKIRITLATCFVIVMPLFYGVNGCISTDYIMACFFLFFLWAHVKKYYSLQVIFSGILVTTKETAAVLICVFCFSYLLLELMHQDRKGKKTALVIRELTNFMPVVVLLIIMITSGRVSFLDMVQLLNWKMLLLVILGVSALAAVIYLCYTHKFQVQSKTWGIICEALIVAGVGISVFCGFVESEYGVIENLNSLGYAGIEYVLLRLKNIFILNFQWMYWIFILGMLFYSIYRKGKLYQNSYVVSMLITIFGFVGVHCFYITYTHPRYYQPIILLVGFVGAIMALAYKNKIITYVMLVITILSFGQNFIGLDKVSENVYATVDIGDGELISTNYAKKELSYSDANVYNLEYTYLKEILREFMEDIEPTEKTMILMPDVSYPYLKSNRSRYVVWGTLWYNDAAKEIYYGDGRLRSFPKEGDVCLKIKAMNQEQDVDLNKYDCVYYIDIPEIMDIESTSVWFFENYECTEYKEYQMGNWKINTYVVQQEVTNQ